MKRWFLLLLPLLLLANTAGAADVPKTINLIFDDRILTLDFRVAGQLIRRVPRHFFGVETRRIPIDLRIPCRPKMHF